jgi:demethylmenaquinone methyltransferase/2-methoxy-6-polyprenyl-1,4-benzoquinol methylase
MPGFDHFDFLAPIYDRVIQPKIPEILARLAKLPTAGSLLDAGGGTGRVAFALRELAEQTLVADASAGMLRQAALKDGLVKVCSTSEALPFPDDTFERVIMVDALHHVYSQAQTAGELWRVLQPGGVLVIEEPDISTFAVRVIALAEKLALMRSHILSAEQIAALFVYPGAQTAVHRQDYTAWVVVEKSQR